MAQGNSVNFNWRYAPYPNLAMRLDIRDVPARKPDIMNDNFASLIRSTSALLFWIYIFASTSSANFMAAAQTNFETSDAEASLADNRARLEALIDRIDMSRSAIALGAFEDGTLIEVTDLNTRQIPRIALKDRTLFFALDNCAPETNFSDLRIEIYPLVVNTGVAIDTQKATHILRAIPEENTMRIKGNDNTTCVVQAKLPATKTHKITGQKGPPGRAAQWRFEHTVATDSAYRAANTIGKIDSLDPSQIVCSPATGLCYNNTAQSDYVGSLSTDGLLRVSGAAPEQYYFLGRQTLAEFQRLYPKLKLEVTRPASSAIIGLLRQHSSRTIIVAVKDNAAGKFSPDEIRALKARGVDIQSLVLRGSHVSILRPGQIPISVTDNDGPVLIKQAEHGVNQLGDVSSAGFLVGNYALIPVSGSNVSVGGRGLNIVVLNKAGGVILTESFDTHSSSYRDEGLYRVTAR